MNVTTANEAAKEKTHMSTFTIDSDNSVMALAGPPAGADQSQSFSTAKELAKLTAEWPVSRLVDTWNSFAGVSPFDEMKPVKKFTSRKVGILERFDLLCFLTRAMNRHARSTRRKGRAT